DDRFEFLRPHSLTIEFGIGDHMIEKVFYPNADLFKAGEGFIKMEAQDRAAKVRLGEIEYRIILSVSAFRGNRVDTPQPRFGRLCKRFPNHQVHAVCVFLGRGGYSGDKFGYRILEFERCLEMPLHHWIDYKSDHCLTY